MNPGDTTPIILAHGICRFDQLLNEAFGLDNQDDDNFHYFRGIRSTLIREGFRCWHTKVSWAASVETRAAELRAELLRITNDFQAATRVHLIAHSMGGLDARHMIFNHQMHNVVASLTTIGTPHKGSSFADWGIERHGHAIPLLGAIGIDATGFFDLTTKRCNEFNDKAESFERTNGVVYRTYAGVQKWQRTFWALQFPHTIIADREGENDGLVSLDSAKWRDDVFVKKIDADHLNEVGWCDWNEPERLCERDVFEKRIRDLYVSIARSI